MTKYDVRRLALVLAVQAEIEGMKIANLERVMPSDAAAYSEEKFEEKRNELENLGHAHDQQLFS